MLCRLMEAVAFSSGSSTKETKGKKIIRLVSDGAGKIDVVYSLKQCSLKFE